MAYVWSFDNKKGYINSKNELAIELTGDHDYEGNFENALAIVGTNGIYGCINKTGQYVVEPIFERIIGVNPNGTFSALINWKSGTI
ncbi:MAG: WG repeat-containing protein [Paenibacillus macerans]|uniref:WG repeat-containing protein n=1 Tax=Paenibacillus macerans TaxID=44252 RepID=UPI000A637EAB|nr:WG repeat-containing protein [Paenibacillus macerans]MCY7556897.1 WG repeat-containing protein [Paenibacillus macerans]MDU5947866.1 WG repeat-containing protein [Paenibacillus macerans]MDU7472736.1 WG repeat-containing protein [Paenibacillus macerans]MEC0139106.1 WG repeat-containing protein [Paenibacillus macerans]MEC0150050.1 WG repeat-containing protein [Paenibacillus macerans]